MDPNILTRQTNHLNTSEITFITAFDVIKLYDSFKIVITQMFQNDIILSTFIDMDLE